jgi:hypothetical protein
MIGVEPPRWQGARTAHTPVYDRRATPPAGRIGAENDRVIHTPDLVLHDSVEAEAVDRSERRAGRRARRHTGDAVNDAGELEPRFSWTPTRVQTVDVRSGSVGTDAGFAVSRALSLSLSLSLPRHGAFASGPALRTHDVRLC